MASFMGAAVIGQYYHASSQDTSEVTHYLPAAI